MESELHSMNDVKFWVAVGAEEQLDFEGRVCSGIYAIKNTVTNKFYVGQSKAIKSRLKEHLLTLRRNCHKNKHLQRAFNSYGEDVFVFCVLKRCSIDDMDYWEKWFIKYYDSSLKNNGYNLDEGGRTGKALSEDTKKKISNSLKGRPLSESHKRKLSEVRRGRKGHPMSDELKRKLLATHIGKKISDEIKRKLSESHKGRVSNQKGKTLSEDTKRKMSVSHKGKFHSEETKQKMRKPKSEEHKRKISEALRRYRLGV